MLRSELMEKVAGEANEMKVRQKDIASPAAGLQSRWIKNFVSRKNVVCGGKVKTNGYVASNS